MAFADTVRDFLATTIHDHTTQILLVAAGALVVALALSFMARIAFWVLGGVGTAAAVWIVASGGFETPVLTLGGIVLLGGWIGGFLVRGMIKLGSVVVTLFSVGLFWMTRWAESAVNGTELWAWYYFAGIAVLAIGLVLAMPTILGKVLGGTVKAVIPGGGKDEKKKPAEIKR